MDGEIDVAVQLGTDVEQSLLLFARKLQLYEVKLHSLMECESIAEKEERDLVRQLKELQNLEKVYKRESSAACEQLVVKSNQFQELTRLASERLSIKALRMETTRLQDLLLCLRSEEESLRKQLGSLDAVDDAAVSALIAEGKALQRRLQQKVDDYQTLRATAVSAVAGALDERAVREQEEAEEAEQCRRLEEAIEDMTLLRVEAELRQSDKVSPKRDGHDAAAEGPTPDQADATSRAAMTRLNLRRAECDSKFSKLAVALGERVTRNKELAAAVGLSLPGPCSEGVQEVRDSTAAALPRQQYGSDGDPRDRDGGPDHAARQDRADTSCADVGAAPTSSVQMVPDGAEATEVTLSQAEEKRRQSAICVAVVELL